MKKKIKPHAMTFDVATKTKGLRAENRSLRCEREHLNNLLAEIRKTYEEYLGNMKRAIVCLGSRDVSIVGDQLCRHFDGIKPGTDITELQFAMMIIGKTGHEGCRLRGERRFKE